MRISKECVNDYDLLYGTVPTPAFSWKDGEN
jgi:hypothetical protein